MVNCPKCSGEAVVHYYEDNRMVTDPCYHCQGSGSVTVEDLRIHDLTHVAYKLAFQAETDYRQACMMDPEGDDYELNAAERGMSVIDYFRARVMDRQDKMAESLLQLDRGTQNLLIEADKLEDTQAPRDVYNPMPTHVPTFKNVEVNYKGWDADSLNEVFGDDNIPF
jgi:hypothetical protein